MPENILFLNVHSFSNVGDAALTYATVQQLQKNFPGCHLSFVVDDLESYQEPFPALRSLYHWLRDARVSGDPKWRLRNVVWMFPATLLPVLGYRFLKRPLYGFTPQALRTTLQGYFDADLIVSKPGGFLYSSGLGLSFFIAFYVMALAILAGKPLYLFPQSVGPFKRPWERGLIRWLGNRTRLFMVREPVSLDLMRACGVSGDHVPLLPDTAFSFQAETPLEPQKWFAERGLETGNRPLMGMTLIQWDSQTSGFQGQAQYEQAMAALVRHFIQHHGGQVILYVQAWGPAESQDDRVPARRILAQLADVRESVYFANEPLPPSVLKLLYGAMDVFIGTRMHSNIFALSEGVPVLAIEYYHKTRGIMAMWSLQEWLIPIGEVETANLLETFERLWAKRVELQKHITNQTESIVTQANQAGVLIAADFKKISRNGQS